MGDWPKIKRGKNGEERLDLLNDCQLLRKDSDPRR